MRSNRLLHLNKPMLRVEKFLVNHQAWFVCDEATSPDSSPLLLYSMYHPGVSQKMNKQSKCSWWWFFTNPFEKYAQVKLDHFPNFQACDWNHPFMKSIPPSTITPKPSLSRLDQPLSRSFFFQSKYGLPLSSHRISLSKSISGVGFSY